MLVTLLHPREFQDAGVIRALLPGEYDLPSVVAHALIAAGVAVLAGEPAARSVAAVLPPETGKRRRRAA